MDILASSCCLQWQWPDCGLGRSSAGASWFKNQVLLQDIDLRRSTVARWAIWDQRSSACCCEAAAADQWSREVETRPAVSIIRLLVACWAASMIREVFVSEVNLKIGSGHHWSVMFPTSGWDFLDFSCRLWRAPAGRDLLNQRQLSELTTEESLWVDIFSCENQPTLLWETDNSRRGGCAIILSIYLFCIWMKIEYWYDNHCELTIKDSNSCDVCMINVGLHPPNLVTLNQHTLYKLQESPRKTYIVSFTIHTTYSSPRDAPQKNKRENVGIFPKWGTPPPPPCLGMTCLFFF